MSHHRLMRVAMVATLALGGSLAASALLAAPASAWTTGPCTSASGVSVVVDFQSLGGSTITRCADVAAGTTGLAALKAAGISVSGTSRWGEAFVCRLAGRPAADESLRIPGNDTYREPCIDTPPASAHWTSWHANNGGSWTYSQSGASSRTVTIGGFEGWSFALGASASSDPPPRVTPTRPEPTPAQAGSGGTGGGDSGGGQGNYQATDSNGTAGQGVGAQGKSGRAASGGTADTNDKAASGSAGAPASTAGAGSGAGDAASPSDDPSSADPAAPPTSSAAAAGAGQSGTGGGGVNAAGTRVPVSTAAAAGILVLAAGAGGGTLWRRRRGRTP